MASSLISLNQAFSDPAQRRAPASYTRQHSSITESFCSRGHF